MSERLFHRLAAASLATAPVVLASVRHTRGATPRKTGSRMLIAERWSFGSVGGGEAESRVITAARALLAAGHGQAEISIDLGGGAGAAGVCGGAMQLSLRCWHGIDDAARAHQLSQQLARAEAIQLGPAELGISTVEGSEQERVNPDPRLLIIGAGHCGQALYDFARHMDFDIWVFDERADCVQAEQFAEAQRRHSDFSAIADALVSPRQVLAVLLSRDYRTDVAALRVLAEKPPAFIGMMGSRRRIHEVRRALPDLAIDFDAIRAPIGVNIQAQTPHEIAVSILAELVAFQNRDE